MKLFNGRKLTKSNDDFKFSGVCGGLAEFFGISSTLVRIIFLLAMMYKGYGIVAYIILLLAMPDAPTKDKIINNVDYTVEEDNSVDNKHED